MFIRNVLLSISFLLLQGCAGEKLTAGAANVLPGAKIVFEDHFTGGAWSGAKLEQGTGYGIDGAVLVPTAYEQRTRLERQVDFTLDEETYLSFDFRCQGYQCLFIHAYLEGGQQPKSVLITHFPSGQLQHVNIPVNGNFHGYRQRRGTDPSALKTGDHIVRLVFELSLTEEAAPAVQIGGLTFYSFTEEVYRGMFSQTLDMAKEALAAFPADLAARKTLLEARLAEAEGLFKNPPARYAPTTKELLSKVRGVLEIAVRIDKYYAPALGAARVPKADYCVGLESSLKRVTRTNERLRFKGQVPAAPEVSLAANEHEAFQLVILPFDLFLRNVKIYCSDLQGPQGGSLDASRITLGRVELVRTQLSPHSNGADLGWVPDPIIPLRPGEGFPVGPDAELPLWVDVFAPSGTPPGTYTGTITIVPENSHATLVPLKVNVWDYEIPRRGVFRTQGNFSIESVEDFYNRKMDTAWLKEWYAFWLDYRFDPVGQYAHYLTPLPELIPFCLERGLNTIHIENMIRIDEVDRAKMDSVYKLLKDKGWLEYSEVLIGDESNNWDRLVRLSKVIHANYPGVKVMTGGDTPQPQLIGYYDVWDPLISNRGIYDPFDLEGSRQALARGEEMLSYVCISPHPPNANVQMDDPLAECRTLFWTIYKYDLQGYEYWGYNVWGDNMVPAGSPRWPEVDWNSYAYDHTNGDGQICYPGPDGLPYASVRLAVNRDGIEDWEALWILEDLARTARELKLDKDAATAALVSQAQALADVPDEVVRDFTHYTIDPQVILGRRAEVSRMIAALREKIGKERAAVYRDRHLAQRKALMQKNLQNKTERARRETK